MTDKSLKSKAIDIKGKSYVLVSDRVLYFNEQYVNGSITTDVITPPDSDYIVCKATVIPDCDKPDRCFTGYSQSEWGDTQITRTSALEVAETSAVGRALGFMGIGVIESIASCDEMHKANARSSAIEHGVKTSVESAEGKSCSKCGSKMAISKTGNLYCSSLCWKKPANTAKPKIFSEMTAEERIDYVTEAQGDLPF